MKKQLILIQILFCLYNLGLLFFKTKDLKNLIFFKKAIIIKNDYKLARDKIIEILSFYEPNNEFSNFISDIDKKLNRFLRN